jgi:hypothetical protein
MLNRFMHVSVMAVRLFNALSLRASKREGWIKEKSMHTINKPNQRNQFMRPTGPIFRILSRFLRRLWQSTRPVWSKE